MWQRSIDSAELRSISALENVKKPLNPNLEPGEEVLVLTDTDHDQEVWKLLATAVRDLGAQPTISLFESREMDYYDPPSSVAEQMKGVDKIICCTTTAMLHSPAGEAAMKAGTPIIAMDGGITLDMLTKGAATADYNEVERIEYEIGKQVFEGGKQAHLTSEYGTDLTLSIEDRVFPYRKPDSDDPPLELYEKRPGFHAVVFPRGEFNVPPDPSTADGTIVFDTTMHHLGKLEEPIEIEIDSGKITDISGGYQAHEFERVLEEYGDEDAYRMPTEFSVGANPDARVTGCQREDKNMLGCIHIGLGTNADVGGEIHSKLHMDGVIARPTLEIDGELKIDHGDILPLDC
jgi:leucyl aminopeptidase (aminopeptidase T)